MILSSFGGRNRFNPSLFRINPSLSSYQSFSFFSIHLLVSFLTLPFPLTNSFPTLPHKHVFSTETRFSPPSAFPIFLPTETLFHPLRLHWVSFTDLVVHRFLLLGTFLYQFRLSSFFCSIDFVFPLFSFGLRRHQSFWVSLTGLIYIKNGAFDFY